MTYIHASAFIPVVSKRVRVAKQGLLAGLAGLNDEKYGCTYPSQ